ncbi:MAG: elongation factor G [Deltaproteobacteria bacterium]|nr:MAG: elongation factor G [Deltaproteobacteria bacterium]TMB21051.1 MAG: elongation factor G [Deltaproteobacteria bacterium]
MPAEEVEKLRNVAIVGQGGAGKTTVADALLFAAGASTRHGRLDDGSSAFAVEPEEIRRKSSITSALHHAAWRKHELNLIDTPGYSAFLHDARNCLRAATGAVLVLGSTGGEVKVETEKIWAWCEELALPRIAFVTRMDRERASIDHALEDLRAVGAKAAVLHVPIGSDNGFRGVVDVLSGRAFLYQGDSGTFQEGTVPAELADTVAKAREQLVETIAEANDVLLEKYLEGTELGTDELVTGLRDGTLARKFLPVLCGAAGRAIGLHPLLDAIVDLLASPAELPPWRGDNPKTGEEVERAADPHAPFAAYVFKTIVDPFAGKLSVLRIVSGRLHADLNCINTARESRERIGHPLKLEGKKQVQVAAGVAGDIVAVAKLKDTASGDTLADEKAPIVFPPLPDAPAAISFALAPKSKADDEKVMQALHRLMEEDTALRVHRDEQTKEFVVSGTGQLHVEVAVERLKRKFGVEVELKAPKVPYKETIKGTAKAQGKHKKQTGGHGQYGDCWLELSPLPRGKGFEFEDDISGGVIPRNFIPAVEKGVREVLTEGIIAGYPIVDVKARLYFGSYHDVDSSEMSFKIAGRLAFKAAYEHCRPCLLEPITTITVIVPDDYMGDVIGDLNSRRGKVLGAETRGSGQQVIRAHVPMSEVLRYAPDLRSMTSGRGDFELEFSHYEEVPGHIAEKIIKEAQAARAERHA